jgi:hypothetical protein
VQLGSVWFARLDRIDALDNDESQIYFRIRH